MYSRTISEDGAVAVAISAAETRRLQRRRRQIGGWVASILLHTILFAFCFASLKGAMVSGGAGTEDGVPQAYWVSLAGSRGGAPAKAEPSQPTLDKLFQRIRDQQSPIASSPHTAPPKADLDKLFDVIDQQRSGRAQVQKASGQGDGESQIDRGGSGSATNGTDAKQPSKQGQAKAPQHAHGPGSTTSTGDGLWGQIAPCWGRLPQVSTVPVTLEITLNGKGLIATPPKIMRPDGASPNEERLISEARALAAVTACMPYRVDALGPKGQSFRVDFDRK